MDHLGSCPTFNYNNRLLPNSIDPNEFFKQQKEIEDILSSAFDDITSIQHLSDDEDDVNCFGAFTKQPSTSNLKIFSNNGNMTSTPLNNHHSNKNNGKLQIHNGNHNFSDILEEDNTIIDAESLENDADRNSDLSLSDHNNLIDINNANGRSSPDSNINNDVQFKDLCYLKQQFVTMNSNYELLQQKYQKLHKLNQTNVNTIESLRSLVSTLERQLKDEQESTEKERRKAEMLESKVNSLEYQINDLQKGDYLSRNQKEQMEWFETLKLRHQKELNELRTNYETKIENLKQRLAIKENELIDNCDLIHKYKKEASYFQEKCQTIEQEMKSKMQIEINNAKERAELHLLKCFDESMKKLKVEWEQKLQEDIDKICDWFENWEEDQDDNQIKLDVRFEKLIHLGDSLKRSNARREQHIQAQISKMEEARRQLERVLLEAKLRNSSISSTSSRSDLMLTEENGTNCHIGRNDSSSSKKLSSPFEFNFKNQQTNGENETELESADKAKMIMNLRLKYEKELKDIREQFESELGLLRRELINKEEETSVLRKKSNKYKQQYQQLVDKHKQELNMLKNEFTKVMNNIVNSHKT